MAMNPEDQTQHQIQTHDQNQPPGHQKQQQRQKPFTHTGLKTSKPTKGSPLLRITLVFCLIFWIIVLLGGLAVLTVYLLFQPKNPRFDIDAATLNAAYLDSGSLLNADISLLANFTNPNKKLGISFDEVYIDMYYGKTLIAASAVEAFSEERTKSKLANVHMVSSQVQLPMKEIQMLKKQIANNTVDFDIKGSFRTRSHYGNLLHLKYKLHGRCDITVRAPPTGVLLSRKCRTKR